MQGELLRGDLLAEEGLEGLTVLRELTDTLVELVRRHLVVAKRPAELGLVVDVRDLGQLLRGRDGCGFSCQYATGLVQ